MKEGQAMREKTVVKRECERVNALLKDEAVELELGTKKSLGRLEQVKNEPSEFSYWAELEFREYVRRELEQHQRITSSILVNSGARLLGLSPVTIKRYMGKLRSKNGPFSGLGDIVTINPNYVPKEDDAYWTGGAGLDTDVVSIRPESTGYSTSGQRKGEACD
jgi:hypothetical protein